MRRTAVLLVAFILAGCVAGETAAPRAAIDPAALTEEWPCGHGFWLSNPEQTVFLKLAVEGGELATPAEVALPSPEWMAAVEVGRNLAANWCDDVIEPDEPEPQVHERWPLVAGTLRVEGPLPEGMCSGGAVTVEATGLVAESPDGDVPVGDLVITNPAWGCFAG